MVHRWCVFCFIASAFERYYCPSCCFFLIFRGRPQRSRENGAEREKSETVRVRERDNNRALDAAEHLRKAAPRIWVSLQSVGGSFEGEEIR